MGKSFFKFLIFQILIISSVFANLHQAPPSFPYEDGTAVFIDFKQAINNVEYKTQSEEVVIKSSVKFETNIEGYPLFDLSAEVNNLEAKINGQAVEVSEIRHGDSLSNTTFKVLNQIVSTGEHDLELSYSITTSRDHHLLSFDVNNAGAAVSDFIYITDYDSRDFLEQVFPSNLEFDQYPMTAKIKVLETDTEHTAYANGSVEVLSKNNIKITYPDFYNSAAFFYHIAPVGHYEIDNYVHNSVDGREIPITIYGEDRYSSKLDEVGTETRAFLIELEQNFGAFPHEKLVIYSRNDDTRSMEYAGATVIGVGIGYGRLGGLTHELIHSYFARSVMPASGAASWFDEAITTLYDEKRAESSFYYQRFMRAIQRDINIWGKMEMGAYQRSTNQNSYTDGAIIIGNLVYQMNGGSMDAYDDTFNAFLRNLHEQFKHQTITSEDIKNSFINFNQGLENSILTTERIEQIFNQFVFNN